MDFVEVLERARQLSQHRRCIAQIHTAHVVALEGIDEALGHAIALWTADGRVDRLEAQRYGNATCLARYVGTAVVGEELQFARLGDSIYRAEAPLHGFHQHVAYRLTRQPLSFPGSTRQDLPIATVLGEGGRDSFSRIALDLEAVGTPAHIARRHADPAIVNAARMPSLGSPGQQQSMPRHDAVDALVVQGLLTLQTSLPVEQCPGPSIAVAGQLGNVATDVGQQ